MSQEQAMLDALGSLGIAWTMHEHEAVFTVEASAKLHEDIAGAHTKNLFLKDAGGQLWLVTAPHDARVDLKALPAVIGSKKLSFGNAEDMERLLGVTPGSVTPLAGFNDENNGVKIVLDSRLASAVCVNVHPLRNTATIGMSGEALVSFLQHCGHEVLVYPLPEPQ
jgi:Ala-tRNA(Pro) deacylase